MRVGAAAVCLFFGGAGCSSSGEAVDSIAGSNDVAVVGGSAASPSLDDLASDPVVDEGMRRISLRVHGADSQLTSDQLVEVLEEVNDIWAPADVCFDVEITASSDVNPDGLDLWMARELEREGLNGYFGDLNTIVSLDYPTLDEAPNPTRHPASRTIAHELGHAMTLGHQNCGAPCYDLLMTSGRRGFQLSDDEISVARAEAVGLATRIDVEGCSAPRVR